MMEWNNTSLFSRLGAENRRNLTQLTLWTIFSNIVIGLIWQVAEHLIYGEIQPRLVDNVVDIVWTYFMLKTYYFGRDDGKAEWEIDDWLFAQAFVEEVQRRGVVAWKLYLSGDNPRIEAKITHKNGHTISIWQSIELETAKRMVSGLNAFIQKQEEKLSKNKEGE